MNSKSSKKEDNSTVTQQSNNQNEKMFFKMVTGEEAESSKDMANLKEENNDDVILLDDIPFGSAAEDFSNELRYFESLKHGKHPALQHSTIEVNFSLDKKTILTENDKQQTKIIKFVKKTNTLMLYSSTAIPTEELKMNEGNKDPIEDSLSSEFLDATEITSYASELIIESSQDPTELEENKNSNPFVITNDPGITSDYESYDTNIKNTFFPVFSNLTDMASLSHHENASHRSVRIEDVLKRISLLLSENESLKSDTVSSNEDEDYDPQTSIVFLKINLDEWFSNMYTKTVFINNLETINMSQVNDESWLGRIKDFFANDEEKKTMSFLELNPHLSLLISKNILTVCINCPGNVTAKMSKISFELFSGNFFTLMDFFNLFTKCYVLLIPDFHPQDHITVVDCKNTPCLLIKETHLETFKENKKSESSATSEILPEVWNENLNSHLRKLHMISENEIRFIEFTRIKVDYDSQVDLIPAENIQNDSFQGSLVRKQATNEKDIKPISLPVKTTLLPGMFVKSEKLDSLSERTKTKPRIHQKDSQNCSFVRHMKETSAQLFTGPLFEENRQFELFFKSQLEIGNSLAGIFNPRNSGEIYIFRFARERMDKILTCPLLSDDSKLDLFGCAAESSFETQQKVDDSLVEIFGPMSLDESFISRFSRKRINKLLTDTVCKNSEENVTAVIARPEVDNKLMESWEGLNMNICALAKFTPENDKEGDSKFKSESESSGSNFATQEPICRASPLNSEKDTLVRHSAKKVLNNKQTEERGSKFEKTELIDEFQGLLPNSENEQPVSPEQKACAAESSFETQQKVDDSLVEIFGPMSFDESFISRFSRKRINKLLTDTVYKDSEENVTAVIALPEVDNKLMESWKRLNMNICALQKFTAENNKKGDSKFKSESEASGSNFATQEPICRASPLNSEKDTLVRPLAKEVLFNKQREERGSKFEKTELIDEFQGLLPNSENEQHVSSEQSSEECSASRGKKIQVSPIWSSKQIDLPDDEFVKKTGTKRKTQVIKKKKICGKFSKLKKSSPSTCQKHETSIGHEIQSRQFKVDSLLETSKKLPSDRLLSHEKNEKENLKGNSLLFDQSYTDGDKHTRKHSDDTASRLKNIDIRVCRAVQRDKEKERAFAPEHASDCKQKEMVSLGTHSVISNRNVQNVSKEETKASSNSMNCSFTQSHVNAARSYETLSDYSSSSRDSEIKEIRNPLLLENRTEYSHESSFNRCLRSSRLPSLPFLESEKLITFDRSPRLNANRSVNFPLRSMFTEHLGVGDCSRRPRISRGFNYRNNRHRRKDFGTHSGNEVYLPRPRFGRGFNPHSNRCRERGFETNTSNDFLPRSGFYQFSIPRNNFETHSGDEDLLQRTRFSRGFNPYNNRYRGRGFETHSRNEVFLPRIRVSPRFNSRNDWQRRRNFESRLNTDDFLSRIRFHPQRNSQSYFVTHYNDDGTLTFFRRC